MATIDLGKIKMVWRGAYNNATAYTPDDVVSSGGSSYICILASTGNAVSNATYWSLLAQGGTDVGTTLTTQGDILYRDGSGLQRLAPGTANQVLKTGGAGANPSWGTLSSDCVKLANGTIGNVASFSIDGYFTTDYDFYRIILINVRNDTANRQFYWRINQGGSAQGGNNYRFAAKGNYTQSGSGNNDTASAGWDQNKFYTGWDLSTGADRGSQFQFDIYDPLSTSNNKFISYNFTLDIQDAAYLTSMFGGGYYNDGGGTAMSGMTFLPQGENFNTGGKWFLYGFKS